MNAFAKWVRNEVQMLVDLLPNTFPKSHSPSETTYWTQSAGGHGQVLDIQSGYPCELECRDLTPRERTARTERRGEEWSRGRLSTSLMGSGLHRHHDLVQRFPFEIRHRGLFAGVPHREQHQQLFMWGAA